MTVRRPPLLLAGVVAAAFAVNSIQALVIPSPWLLPDELRVVEAAREPARARTLYAPAIAPLWTAGTATAATATTLLGALLAALLAVPAYLLARGVATAPWAALAAALAAVSAPTLYAAAVVPVAAATLPAALACVLLARLGVRGGRRDAAAAAALLVLSVALWPPLAWFAVPAAVLAVVRRTGVAPLLRWPGASAFVVAAAAAHAAFHSARAASPDVAAAAEDVTGTLVAAGAGAGALFLGLGLLPGVLAVAAAVAAARPGAPPPLRFLAALFTLGVAALALGSGVVAAGRPGAGLDDSLLLAAVPLVVAAAAAGVAARPGALALAVGAAVVGLSVVAAARADGAGAVPSLALAARLGLPVGAYAAAVAVAMVMMWATLSLFLASARSAGARLAAPLAGAVLLLAAVTAAAATAELRTAAQDRLALLPQPPSLVADRAGDRDLVVVTGPGAPPRALEALLFWTPQARVADPPAAAREVEPVTGLLRPPLVGEGLVFVSGALALAGETVASAPVGSLVRTEGLLVRVAETLDGVYPDGWSGEQAVYRRFHVDAPGTVEVVVSRVGWGGPEVPGTVTVSVGLLGETPRRVERFPVPHAAEERVAVPVPGKPFAVVVEAPTFTPAEYGFEDARTLGAQLQFAYTAP